MYICFLSLFVAAKGQKVCDLDGQWYDAASTRNNQVSECYEKVATSTYIIIIPVGSLILIR